MPLTAPVDISIEQADVSHASPSPLLVDRVGFARMLAISPRHLARLDDSGRIPQARKLGRLKRWPIDEIQRWIEAGCPSRDAWIATQKTEKAKKR